VNKYLMMSAAALLGSAPAFAGDQAKTHTIHFYSSGGQSYCDGMTFAKTGVHVAAGQHLNEDRNGTNVQIIGTVDKIAFHLSENYSQSVAYTFDIFKPIRNGGTWDLWVCLDGTTCFEGNTGTYQKGFPANRASHVPTTVRVAAMIAERRAVRAGQAH
jgi:hypothetical protein